MGMAVTAGNQLNMFLGHFYTVSSSLPVNFRYVSGPLPVRIFSPVCVLVMSLNLASCPAEMDFEVGKSA